MLRSSLRGSACVVVASSALLLAGCSSSSNGAPPAPPTHPAGTVFATTYVAGRPFGVAIAPSGEVMMTLLDVGKVVTGQVATAAFGPFVGVGSMPLDVAFAPRGATAFVANGADHRVSVIDVRSNSVSSTLTVDPGPLRVLVSPDGARLYVTTEGDPISGSNLFVFDAHSLVLIKKVLIGAIANGIAYDSAHGRVYVSSMATDSIYEIDAATNAVVRMFYGGTTPQEVVLTPDHSEVWVANESDAGILIFDRATGDSIGSVPNTERAFGLAVSPDGERFYVTMLALGTFSIIDRNTRTVLSTQSGGFNSAPGRIRFNQSGTSAVIADEGMGMIVIQ